MAFRFIHTADWQIGKTFGRYPSEVAHELRVQRFRTVAALAEQARAMEVDAVLVAGDVFDSNTVTDRTLVQLVDALKAFTGTWVLLPGNHDAALTHSVWSRLRGMGLPDHVVVADEAVPIDRWDARALVLPAPLRRRRESLDLTAWFDDAPSSDGVPRIGLAHGTLENRLPDGDAGNLIGEHRARDARLDYLALGDWHGALEVAHRTHYAGTPEPDRHKDNESGTVQLVEVATAGAPPAVSRLRVGRFAWVRHEVALLDGTCDRVEATLDALPGDPRQVVLALHLSGSLTLAERDRLERLKRHWDARLHHLEVDDAAVQDEPTADDLDTIDTAGFVRLAVDRLRAQADNPADPDRDAARMALRMIYLDHLGPRS